MTFFFLHDFWTERAILLSKYFKKPVKDCEFADLQHNTLILLFGYVVLIKIYLIFNGYKLCKRKKQKTSSARATKKGIFLVIRIRKEKREEKNQRSSILWGKVYLL